MDNSKVVVVIVTFNRSAIIQKALDCIESQTYFISNIVVVDNNSSDNTSEILLERKKKNSKISIVSSSENVGYGAGLALGMNWSMENLDVDFFG